MIVVNKLDVTRYRVVGIKDNRAPGNEQLLEALSSYAFREPPRNEAKETWGFVDIHNLLETSFNDLNKTVFDAYALFALRCDKLRVPAKLLKAHLEMSTAAWCQENGRSRCPASVKAELKDTVEQRLLGQVLPSIQTYGVAWHLNEGWLIFHSHSDSVQEKFIQLFYQAFGLRLVPCSCLDMLDDKLLQGQLAALPVSDYRSGTPVLGTELSSVLPLDIPQEEPLPWVSHVCSEFLLWLWWSMGASNCSMELPEAGLIEFWGETRMVLRLLDETSSTATLTGDNPCESMEARAAVEGGKVPYELSVSLRNEEREFFLALSLPSLRMRRIKLPQIVRGGGDEVVYERMMLYEEAYGLVSQLFTMFADQRVSPAWYREIAPRIQTWLGK